jgi:hypothetical protein
MTHNGLFKLQKTNNVYHIELPTELVERFGWKENDDMHMLVMHENAITIDKVKIPEKQLQDVLEYIKKASD